MSAVELDDEIVIYDDVAGALHRLSPSAAIVWSCCDGSRSVGAIIAEVSRVYQTDASTVSHDVLDAIRTFGRMGLLEGMTEQADGDPVSSTVVGQHFGDRQPGGR